MPGSQLSRGRPLVPLLLLSLLSACRTPGQRSDGTVTNPETRLVGAWRAAVVTTRAMGRHATNTAPPPSLFIFTRNHYSQIYESGDTARADFAGPRPSETEKIAAFDSFVANAGTYRVVGSVIVLEPIVAKRPRPASGYWTIPHEFGIRGDTLFTVDRGPAGAGSVEFRVTWVRLE